MNTRAAKHNAISSNSIEVSPAVAKSFSWSVALAVAAATTVKSAPMISSTVSLFFDAVHVATGSFYAKHTMDVVVHEHFIHRICPNCVLA